jgi:hypothetical protein
MKSSIINYQSSIDKKEKALVGMAGVFDNADALMGAAARVRDAGYTKWDCHTPYPVHGLDRAMGLKFSPVPIICLTSGFVGAGVGMWMQWWMDAKDYPLVIGGKALFSWPAFVPITFELFVLFAAASIMISLIVLCRLWRWHSPLYDAGVMTEITRDRFAVVLGAEDRHFTEAQARDLLTQTGCQDIRPLYEPTEEPSIFE